jgi:hypothetical protein
MVKLQIFIVCNERLQRSPNYQAHFLADMMLEYEWEDSKWPYQLEVAQQVDTLCHSPVYGQAADLHSLQ